MKALQTLRELMGLGGAALGLQQQQTESAQAPLRGEYMREQTKNLRNRNALAPYELQQAQEESSPEQRALMMMLKKAQMANLLANTGSQAQYGLPPGFAEKIAETMGLSAQTAQPQAPKLPEDLMAIYKKLLQSSQPTK